jgi:4-hydroxy-tetrahydrodipicolinate synthase
MKEPEVFGIVVAAVTPFNDDLSIDVEGAKWLYKVLEESGVNGIFISGTTGEWPSLRIEERITLASKAKEVLKSTKVLLGVSGISPFETYENAAKVRDLDIDFIVVTPPLYYKPDAQELSRYFVKVAEAAEKPTIIYSIPSNVGYNIPVESVARAAEESSLIAGIKATVPDLHYIHDLIIEVKDVRKNFKVLAGYGEYMLDTLIAGGDGAVDAISNVVPKATSLILKYWKEGRIDDAIKVHRDLIKISRLLRPLGHAPVVLKTLLSELGTPITNKVRPPLRELDIGSLTTLTKLLCEKYKEYLLPGTSCEGTSS